MILSCLDPKLKWQILTHPYSFTSFSAQKIVKNGLIPKSKIVFGRISAGLLANIIAQRFQVGGIEEHIHALILAPTTYSPSQIAKFLKGESSKWIHEEFPKLSKFGWQDGYSIFSVSRSIVPKVVDYINLERVFENFFRIK